jgi:hypothetical protein
MALLDLSSYEDVKVTVVQKTNGIYHVKAHSFLLTSTCHTRCHLLSYIFNNELTSSAVAVLTQVP